MTRGIIIAIIILTKTTFCIAQQTIDNVVYSKIQLQEDFGQLRKYLETKHPNLYLYTSKPTMDSVFNSLIVNIEPMTATQFYYYINSIQPFIKDGHTYLYPSEELTNYNAKNALYLPFDVRWINYKLYIVQNFTNNKDIKIGDALISINGKKAIDIFTDMCNHQVRDGNNISYAEWINQYFFRSYLCNYFGYEPTYKVEYISDNENKIAEVNGLKLDSIINIRNSMSYKLFDYNIYKSGINYEFKNSTALLNIRTWDNNDYKKKYHQNFKKEVHKFYSELSKNRIENLIIDLRNNQGGSYTNGIYLLKYLLQKPFNYFYSFKVLNRKGELKNTIESSYATRKVNPHKNSFKGKIYVITNGGSFSNSGIFSSIIKATDRGTLVGTETGGSGVVLTGGGDKTYYLTNTKIGYSNTIIEMKVLNIDNKGTGVKPNVELKPTIQDYMTNTDVVLKYIYKEIEK